MAKCPPEYPYESLDGSQCLSKCPDTGSIYYYIYEIGEAKKCIRDCKEYNKFFFEKEKN